MGCLHFLGHLHFEVVFSIYLMSRPNLLFTASKSEIWNLSVALLSQAKNLSVALLSQAPALLGTISWISGMSEQCLTIVPLQKLTGTDRTGRQADRQAHRTTYWVRLTVWLKNEWIRAILISKGGVTIKRRISSVLVYQIPPPKKNALKQKNRIDKIAPSLKFWAKYKYFYKRCSFCVTWGRIISCNFGWQRRKNTGLVEQSK